VDQPYLPAGSDLHRLYRAMRDDNYLVEEAGRRATARRVVDLLGRRHEPGRLLDVGCGHGLLLDEARRAGWKPVGLELSTHAAAYARDHLGAEVHEVAFEDFDPGSACFEAILIVDVFEHLADPLAALDRCVDLLVPGGLLCLVTPDPSSPTARIAGRRWWGYVPAHACLIPGRTLRELLSARGLEVCDDVPFVRTFSRGYWLTGMAERGGPLSAFARALARAPGAGRPLSLSLGDERVLVARRGVESPVGAAARAGSPRAAAASRG
jgi:SAM-dependent methyltransferase